MAAVARWVAALARRPHRHAYRADWLDPTDERCWCGARRDVEPDPVDDEPAAPAVDEHQGAAPASTADPAARATPAHTTSRG